MAAFALAVVAVFMVEITCRGIYGAASGTPGR